MSINTTAIAKRVASVGVTLNDALTIVGEVVSLIEMAETAYDNLKGSEKFASVKAGLLTLLDELHLTDKAAALWRTIAPVISLIVTIYNLKGVFTKSQPVNAPNPPAVGPA